MSAAAGPDIIENGLVLCLDAANRQSYAGSGTVWRDLAGSNNGTLTNGPTFSSANGGSIVFDGVNDFVQTTQAGLQVGTLLTFFKPIVSINGSYFEGLIDNDTPGSYGQGVGINNGVYQAILDNQFWSPNVSVDIGMWQMCALTFNSTTANFYKNGILRSTLAYTQGSVTTTTFKIGRSNANNRFINGSIAQVSIYNRALTPAEILQNYNATKSRFSLT